VAKVEAALRYELTAPTVAECGVPKCNEPATHCLHHSDHPDTAGHRVGSLEQKVEAIDRAASLSTTMRNRHASLEQRLEHLDAATAGAIHDLVKRLAKAEQGREAADAVLDDVLQGLDKLNGRAGKLEAALQHNDKRIDGLVTGEVGARERLLRIEEWLNGDSYGTGSDGLRKRLDEVEKRLSAVDSYGVDALREALGELGFDPRRLDRLDRAIEELSGAPSAMSLGERVTNVETALCAGGWVAGLRDRIDGLSRSVGAVERSVEDVTGTPADPQGRREHATAAFAYVCGRMGKPMYDVSGPLCGEPLPNAWGTCPFPKPCPFHTGAERAAEDAAK